MVVKFSMAHGFRDLYLWQLCLVAGGLQNTPVRHLMAWHVHMIGRRGKETDREKKKEQKREDKEIEIG